jgi:hypothetical protein
MGKKISVRTWDRPHPGERSIARTSDGEYMIDGDTGRATRVRGSAEQIRDQLLVAFSRLGFKPKSIKVIEVKREAAPPNERGAFYLNLGYLRGLDPDEVYRLLHEVRSGVRRFPDRCGQRKVFEALARLEQRVEAPPALVISDVGSAISERPA